MQHVKNVLIGALIMGLGGAVYIIIATFFLPLIGLEMNAVSLSKSGTTVLSVIGGIIMFFLYVIWRKQDKIEAREKNTDEKIDTIQRSIAGIQAPIEEKIDARKQKDVEQDKDITKNKNEIEKLAMRLSEVEKDMGELKQHIDKQFDDVKKLILSLTKKK